MSEYIKREDAIKAFADYLLRYGDDYSDDNAEHIARELLQSADVIEVVRCKDCIHWLGTFGVCDKLKTDTGEASTQKNDYCSYGERKDSERTIFLDETIDETCGYGKDGESE